MGINYFNGRSKNNDSLAQANRIASNTEEYGIRSSINAIEPNNPILRYDGLYGLIGKSRPVASEYSQIADHLRQAIEDVYYGVNQPKQALDDAAKRSVRVLGW